MLEDYRNAQKAIGFHQYTDGSRPKGDFYATPQIAVDTLLEREQFGSQILEPCCGNGAISKILIERGYNVVSRDLHDWGFGETGKDFLTEPIQDVDAVITNPPFNVNLPFAYRALECTKARKGKVALLNRVQWLEGKARKKLFTEMPLKRVWVYSKRLPRMHRFDFTGKPGTSLLCFAWFVFDWNYEGEPLLGWI